MIEQFLKWFWGEDIWIAATVTIPMFLLFALAIHKAAKE